MAIETLLTLLVAAGILLVAGALRLLAWGITRATAALSGDGVRATFLFVIAALYSAASTGARNLHRASLRADARFMTWWSHKGLPRLMTWWSHSGLRGPVVLGSTIRRASASR